MTSPGFTLSFTEEAAQDGESPAYLLGRLTGLVLTFISTDADGNRAYDVGEIDRVVNDYVYIKNLDGQAGGSVFIPSIKELIYQ